MSVPTLIARHLPEDRYAWWVGKGMDRAYRRALRRPTVRLGPIEVDDLRGVVFSDHHRGIGDNADDFRRCEEAYAAALGSYVERGYGLWLLGDVEELWANRTAAVMQRYQQILTLEDEFDERLLRFYGNHDLAWRNPLTVYRHLPGKRVHEAMIVEVTDSGKPLGKLFLTHGHQGTIDSGNLLLVPVSRFVVRFVWGTLQRWRGFPNTSPAEDALLRHRHDEAMARWAHEHAERLVLIAGHTHHPVFLNTDPPDLVAELQARTQEYELAVEGHGDTAETRAAQETARIRALRDEPYDPPDLKGSSYFNSGCCSFADGDVTGLEIADGEVRLVRWQAGGARSAEVLQRRSLRDVFATLRGSPGSHRLPMNA